MKKNEGKPDPSLFYTSALYETIHVRAFGIKKHGSVDGWKSTKPKQHYDPAIRHIRAVMEGEPYDKESGRLHLAHAMCSLMFEIERKKKNDEKRKRKNDERKKEKEDRIKQEKERIKFISH